MANQVHPSFEGLLRSFSLYPNRLAITDKNDVDYTYAEFYKHISWSRKVLEKKGVKKGTRVLLAVPMSMELYALMEALFSLGAVIIFLDPWLKGAQMAAIIRQVKPKLLVCTPKIKWGAMFMPACWTIDTWLTVKKVGTSDERWEIEALSDDDTALITFTGGSSGIPKGADRSFGFLAAQLSVLQPHLQSEDGPIIDYCNFPMVGLADFAVGNHLVIPKINLMQLDKANANEVWNSIVNKQVARTITSPSLLAKIKQGMDQHKSSASIKSVVTGGAPIPFSLINGFVSDFPAIETEAIYGSTEAEPIATTDFSAMNKEFSNPLKGIFSGAAVNEIELRIIEPSNEPVPTEKFEAMRLPDGEAGELVVLGEHVNKGYYENEKAFIENKIVDNDGQIWHRTGDVGYKNDIGIFLVGRLHRVVQVGNEKFYPYPLELLLEMELGIKDSAYVQDECGKVILHLGKSEKRTDERIFNTVKEAKYPLTDIRRHNIELPRDSRHRSKLDLNKLLEL